MAGKLSSKADHRGAYGGCWETLLVNPVHGYGEASVDGRRQRMHRAVWEALFGPIPAGLMVLHRCDNRACYRPEHLYLGTHHRNMKDRDERNRTAKGERHAGAILTEDDVRSIRSRYVKGRPFYPGNAEDLGAEFGVSTVTIYAVANGRLWRHVA